MRGSSCSLTTLASPLGRERSSSQEGSCLDPEMMDECRMGSTNQGSTWHRQSQLCPAAHEGAACSWVSRVRVGLAPRQTAGAPYEPPKGQERGEGRGADGLGKKTTSALIIIISSIKLTRYKY